MKKIKLTLPTSWNGLTDRQLEKMAVLFATEKPGARFDVKVFLILVGARWWQFCRAARALLVLSQVPLSELRSFYHFVYEQCNRTVFIPHLFSGKQCFYAPMARLNNLCAEEFAVAEDLHRLWHKERDRKALEYLAAVLYSDAPHIRPPFLKAMLDRRAEFFRKVPIGKLLAMEIAYTGCKHNIVARYPKAFPKTAAKGKGGKTGFGAVILQMAGGKFGTHKETGATNIYTFLEEFQNNLVTAEKTRQELEKMKRNGKNRNA